MWSWQGVLIGGIVCAAVSASAQEGLRNAVENDRAYEQRESPDYFPRNESLSIGPVLFSGDLSYGLEWNDNVRLGSGDPGSPRKSDILHVPQFNGRAMWQATDETRLSFGIGVGYRKYMDNDDLSRVTITPDSEFAIDIKAKDFLLTIYDRANYSQDVVNEGGLSGVAQFPRLENTVGLRAIYVIDHWLFELGYGHFNFISDGSEFDYLSRSSEQLHARIAYRIAKVTRVGIEASSSFTDYDNETRNDNESISVGPFVDWQIRRDLRVTARGGYVRYEFDPTPFTFITTNNLGMPVSNTIQIPVPTLNGNYYGLTIKHDLTDHLTHVLTVDRSVQQGVSQGGGVTESLLVSYDVLWAFHQAWDASVRGFYEQANQPRRVGTGANTQNIDEEYDRLGATINLRWRPIRKLSLSVGYRYVTKDSDFVAENNNYYQNVVFFRAGYQF